MKPKDRMFESVAVSKETHAFIKATKELHKLKNMSATVDHIVDGYKKQKGSK